MKRFIAPAIGLILLIITVAQTLLSAPAQTRVRTAGTRHSSRAVPL